MAAIIEKSSAASLMARLMGRPAYVPAGIFKSAARITQADREALKKAGLTQGELSQILAEQLVVNFDRHSIYRECDRAICFTGDTRVRLLNGTTPTLKEMAENEVCFVGKYVLSINPQNLRMEPDKIIACRKTKSNADLLEIGLDNGEKIRCTPEHRFMLRDGTYCEAQNLHAGTSLMPLYISKSLNGLKGYDLVYLPDGSRTYVHRLVGSYFRKEKLPRNMVVHHKDFDKNNNDPSNFRIMSSEKHKEYHARLSVSRWAGKTLAERVGKERAQEIAKKISTANMGKVAWNKGRTKETDVRVAKYAHNLEGKQPTLETIEKLRVSHTGHKHSDATRKKLSERTGMGTYQRTAYHKDICSKAMERRWADPAQRDKLLKHLAEIRPAALEKAHAATKAKKVYLNHKIDYIKWLDYTEDVYDITTERNHNFPLAAGVFVHNCHWLMGGAMGLYADVATAYSRLHNSSVWVTSESEEYEKELNGLLERIGTEEKVYDWAWTTGSYGDHFVQVKTHPTHGVIAIDDNLHPIAISRADKDGRLLGFFDTPLGYNVEERQLKPPWEYIHFRILGTKKRRPLYGDPAYSEYRSINIMAPETRRISSQYGSSLMTQALPSYKRLRMSEDCLLMARVSKGVLRYLYKLKVDGSNQDQIAELIEDMATILKRARALDTSSTSTHYEEKDNSFSVMEDIVIPVWGDAKNDLIVEKLGGECLRGDVKIRLMDGTDHEIKEMADNKEKYIGKDIYACTKDGEVVARRINNVLMTRPQTTFVRVHIDNGEHFDVTPDHPCMLRDGTFKMAELLQAGESLMPLYLRKSESKKTPGYEEVYIPATGKYKLTHRVVAEDLLKDEREGKIKALILTGIEHNKKEVGVYLNHKVVSVEKLDIIEDAYDLVIEGAYDKNGGPEHCFALSCGVFVHNTDIRWITDIVEQRNQTAAALSVPLQMLGGFMNEMPDNSGSPSLEKLDIRFARSARRLQRSQINGYKRICQIHLASIGKDPNPKLFEVNMSETSSAEEIELMENLDKGTDIVDKMADMFDKLLGDKLEKVELLDYLNQKILKLNDLDIQNLIKNVGEAPVGQEGEAVRQGLGKLRDKIEKRHKEAKKMAAPRIENTDLFAHTPGTDTAHLGMNESHWMRNYKDCKITVTPEKYDKDGKLLPLTKAK